MKSLTGVIEELLIYFENLSWDVNVTAVSLCLLPLRVEAHRHFRVGKNLAQDHHG